MSRNAELKHWLCILLPCVVLWITAAVRCSADPQLIDTSLTWTNTPRDGTTVVLGYRIQSDSPASITLGANLVGPCAEIVDDKSRESTVSVSAGTEWYTRNFYINLPPDLYSGLFDVVYNIKQGETVVGSITRQDSLTLELPVPIRISILMYHKVGPIVYSQYWVRTAMFRRQMEALKAYGYTPVTTQELMDFRAGIATPPQKPILITFDDGYENWYTDVFPILSDPAINFKAVFFIPTGKVGLTNSWNIGDGNPVINHLTWDEIRELHTSDLIDFQSHTVNHPALSCLTPEQVLYELTTSKQQLAQNVGVDARYIAYPFGAENSTVEAMAWQAGYMAGFTTMGWIEPT